MKHFHRPNALKLAVLPLLTLAISHCGKAPQAGEQASSKLQAAADLAATSPYLYHYDGIDLQPFAEINNGKDVPVRGNGYKRAFLADERDRDQTTAPTLHVESQWVGEHNAINSVVALNLITGKISGDWNDLTSPLKGGNLSEYEERLQTMAKVLKDLQAPQAAQAYVQAILNQLDHDRTINSLVIENQPTLVWNRSNTLTLGYAAAQDSTLVITVSMNGRRLSDMRMPLKASAKTSVPFSISLPKATSPVYSLDVDMALVPVGQPESRPVQTYHTELYSQIGEQEARIGSLRFWLYLEPSSRSKSMFYLTGCVVPEGSQLLVRLYDEAGSQLLEFTLPAAKDPNSAYYGAHFTTPASVPTSVAGEHQRYKAVARIVPIGSTWEQPTFELEYVVYPQYKSQW